jgi:hypothetical protein
VGCVYKWSSKEDVCFIPSQKLTKQSIPDIKLPPTQS